MDVRQPSTPSEADDLLAGIVDQWESGGKAQLQDLLSQTLLASSSTETPLLDWTLDVVWGMDAEIDTRKELATDLGESDDISLGALPDSPVTAASARSRLAGVVKELVK
ncbi:uncharacterized protein PFL1_04858 [Pseudozyma flocculosa PF-1]|uniref:Uncharacterized protein n=1 Tax=Pseudozyma flocculosa PF-1 TaxID=1277687 RepID=A0A061HAT9_9BASI|nr:uncharacterized protein PFL1_04858 [Pseudozyma flocculosa PF-1]EPQ27721.1 hypothetical protein PFL1_04858 [Pseudozyma flocculosa PF-1]